MGANKNSHESLIPVIDEGWWSSVLMEENHFSAHSPLHLEADKSEIRKDTKETASEKKIIIDWGRVKDLYSRDQIIELTVIGHNRGGLLVEGEDLYGFVPLSHLIDLAGKANDLDRQHNLEPYLGRLLHLKVIECVPEDERIVFSERAAQSEAGKRAEIFNELQPGQHVKGIVTNVTEFGAFVDLGGVEGLIHISELSWGRVLHPNQIIQVGNVVDVQVLDLAPERCRVALSLKRLFPNPWVNASIEFPEGCIKPAIITSVLSYGAFARLEAGIEGLIHASEIPQAQDMLLKEFLSEGQQVQVRVLHVDSTHQRMGLSMRLE